MLFDSALLLTMSMYQSHGTQCSTLLPLSAVSTCAVSA